MIRGLSFDLDGTLYPVSRARALWRLRRERGLLVALMAARERMRHEPPLEDSTALIRRETELVAPSFGLHPSEAEARLRALHAALPAALTKNTPPFPHVRVALEAAHARGLSLAVLSDYDPGDKLRWLGLDDLPWKVILGCDTLGALKPHPRAFVALAERMKIPPAELIHVGDREDLDVEGALGAGFRAWLFGKKSAKTRAEKIFAAWSPDMFDQI